MLDSFFSLQLGVDFGGSGSYYSAVSCILLYIPRPKEGLDVPAAATGSALLPAPGLRGSRLSGLRVRVVSDCRDEGDRERRSNRDCRRGSGVVWSKRERFGRRSSSAMVAIVNLRSGVELFIG